LSRRHTEAKRFAVQCTGPRNIRPNSARPPCRQHVRIVRFGQSERVGLPVMTSHQIGRHAFAARLLRQRKTLKEVQEAGGWSVGSMPMLAATYAHLEMSAVEQAVLGADVALRGMLQQRKKDVANG
jgi:hypothetical protein